MEVAVSGEITLTEREWIFLFWGVVLFGAFCAFLFWSRIANFLAERQERRKAREWELRSRH